MLFCCSSPGLALFHDDILIILVPSVPCKRKMMEALESQAQYAKAKIFVRFAEVFVGGKYSNLASLRVVGYWRQKGRRKWSCMLELPLEKWKPIFNRKTCCPLTVGMAASMTRFTLPCGTQEAMAWWTHQLPYSAIAFPRASQQNKWRSLIIEAILGGLHSVFVVSNMTTPSLQSMARPWAQTK